MKSLLVTHPWEHYLISLEKLKEVTTEMKAMKSFVSEQIEVWNSQVTKSSYKSELLNLTSHFELPTQKYL